MKEIRLSVVNIINNQYRKLQLFGYVRKKPAADCRLSKTLMYRMNEAESRPESARRRKLSVTL